MKKVYALEGSEAGLMNVYGGAKRAIQEGIEYVYTCYDLTVPETLDLKPLMQVLREKEYLFLDTKILKIDCDSTRYQAVVTTYYV